MSNPFKAGDKLVYTGGHWHQQNVVLTVRTVIGDDIVTEEPYLTGSMPVLGLNASAFRAAIKGVDYDTHPEITSTWEPNTGHLPDGSSVQKHSAGPLYPCVLIMRGGLLGQNYDVGVISPRNQEPLWFSNHDTAVAVAELIKQDLS